MLAPLPGRSYVVLLYRAADYRLHAPAGLGEAAYLSGDETDLTAHLLSPLQYSSRFTEAQNLLSGYLLRHELQIPVWHEVQLAGVEFFEQLPSELYQPLRLLEQGVP